MFRSSTADAESFWTERTSVKADSIAAITANCYFVMVDDVPADVYRVPVLFGSVGRKAEPLIRPEAADEFSRVAIELEGDTFT